MKYLYLTSLIILNCLDASAKFSHGTFKGDYPDGESVAKATSLAVCLVLLGYFLINRKNSTLNYIGLICILVIMYPILRTRTKANLIV